jgi:hypothetical protein
MPIVRVVKPHMLNIDGKLTQYLTGQYEVSDEVAGHWYFKMHLEGYEEPPPPEGTHQYAAVQIAEQAARLGEPVSEQGQKAKNTPLPQGVTQPETHYFAGKPQPEDPKATSWMKPPS